MTQQLITTASCLALMLIVAGCGPSTALRKEEEEHGHGPAVGESTEFELPDSASWLAVEVADDVVYTLGQPLDAQMVGSSVRYLAAFDANDGNQKWQVEFNSPSSLPSYQADLIYSDGLLVYSTENATMGLSPSDGAKLWAIDAQNNQAMNPIGVGKGMFYAWTWPNLVYGYSLKDGTQTGSWTMTGYNSILEAWTSSDGSYVVAKAEPQSSSAYGEEAVVVLDLKSGSVTELFRHPYNNGERFVVGPRYNGTNWPNVEGSDHVALVTKKLERVTVEGWSVVSGEEEWTEETRLDPDAMYTSAYYAPQFLITSHYGLMQEPAAEGVILRNVLRLHLHALDALSREWTNVVPTQHYVDMMVEVDKSRVLVHTRNDAQAERWYLFNAKTGDLIWSSREQEYVGQTRDMATDGSTMARLMTNDWVTARLFVDNIGAPTK